MAKRVDIEKVRMARELRREHAGWTQERIAEEMKIGLRTVQNYLNDKWLAEKGFIGTGEELAPFLPEEERPETPVPSRETRPEGPRPAFGARELYRADQMVRHEADLYSQARRTIEVASGHRLRSVLSPREGLEAKMYQALREDTEHKSLPRLLDDHEAAVLEYEAGVEVISAKLRSGERVLMSKLPKRMKTHPWTANLVGTLESEVWQNLPSRTPYSGRTYADLPAGDRGGHRVAWGEFLLTESTIGKRNRAAGAKVKQAHQNLWHSGDKFFLDLKNRAKGVTALRLQIIDILESLIVERSILDRCVHFPP